MPRTRSNGQVMTVRALNRATLARQMLLARDSMKVPAAVERLAGMQAQLARPPFIGLWTRLEEFDRADLIRAIVRREVVRGTMMRGTIHLMSRRDYLAMRPAIQPVLSKALKAILGAALERIDTEGLVRAARTYFEQTPCTFAELRGHLGSRYPSIDERAMGFVVRMQLPLVQVPDEAETWAYPAVADFAVADAYLGEPVEREAAAHALALRYFVAFGPATIQDFQTWSGLSNVRPIVDDLRSKLVVLNDERGRELFDVPKSPREVEDADAPVRFLPDYDNLLLAYADRSRIVAEEHKRYLFSKNLMIPSAFLVDGRVAGLWRIERKKQKVVLVLKPFATLTKKVRASLDEEGARLVRFVEPDAGTFETKVAALS